MNFDSFCAGAGSRRSHVRFQRSGNVLHNRGLTPGESSQPTLLGCALVGCILDCRAIEASGEKESVESFFWWFTCPYTIYTLTMSR